MRKTHLILIVCFSLVLFSLSCRLLLAQMQPPAESEKYLNEIGPGTLIREKGDLIELFYNAVRGLMGFLGVITVVVIIQGGLMWMLSKGEEEKIKKAKAIIKNGLTGLTVILVSYALMSFIVKYLPFLLLF